MVQRERSPLGSDIHQVGHVALVQPIPPVPENTRYFDAGPLRIGVEHRLLNNRILDEYFGNGVEHDLVPDLEGFSIHVFDAAANQEKLRFDMFAGDLHYHYILEPARIISVGYDEIANGPMFDWSLRCLTNRLPEMLTTAGAPQLAASVSQAALEDITHQIEEIGTEIRSTVAAWDRTPAGAS
jgi:hypothetical protein